MADRVRLHSPAGSGSALVAKDRVERFLAAGWKPEATKSAPAPKRSAKRSKAEKPATENDE